MPKIDGMTIYHKIKDIDNNVLICLNTADKNYSEDLRKGIIDIDKIVLYKPVLLKDLKIRLTSYCLSIVYINELFLSVYYFV